MLLVDEPLIRANLAAYADPDPDRAFRYRPFVYTPARQATGINVARADPGHRISRRRPSLGILSALQRRFAAPQATPIVCCVPSCC